MERIWEMKNLLAGATVSCDYMIDGRFRLTFEKPGAETKVELIADHDDAYRRASAWLKESGR